jgi:thiol-disulfide isomerase/thioredoxin
MQREVDQKQFKKQILDYWGISVVKFYDTWNAECDILFPVFNALSEIYADSSEIRFYSVNIETQTQLRQKYDEGKLPKIVFFRHGRVFDELSGIPTTNRALSVMIEKIENALAAIKN